MSNSWKRVLSVMLTLVMALGLAVPAGAASSQSAGRSVTWEKVDDARRVLPFANKASSNVPNETQYKDSDVVRVSIFLQAAPAIELYAIKGIGTNASAMAYRDELERTQNTVAGRISAQALNGQPLDVVHHLTLAANAISANVPYGAIEAIKAVDGVRNVALETRYEPAVVSTGAADPQMSTSGEMIGSYDAWAAGYTGAGSKVAIIDTGLGVNHISFDADAFEYAIDSLDADVDLLDEADVAAVWDQLNISSTAYRPGDVYLNAKVPFAFNYVDGDLDVTHANDSQGEHGSHVAGIATANRYIKTGEDEYEPALDTVYTQGVAPDAQVLVMKVFGKGGGAYDSDYFLAIEDAIVLGADSVNLSLGSAVAGMATSDTEEYQNILNGLERCGTTVSMSAGNNSYWAAETWDGYLYSDGANYATGGSPGSFANAFTVASVDNIGATGSYVTVGGQNVFYTETDGYGNAPMTSIAGEHPFVYVDSVGVFESGDDDFADLDLTGKVALCNRGETSFYQKANAAVEAGAIGVIIVNNQAGTISMNLTGYEYSAPAVSITMADGALFKTGEPTGTAASGADIYEGSVTVAAGVGVLHGSTEEPYTMSSFSSWGTTGDLALKPEITAPGGNIYSVNGLNNTGYESMSGTSMAAPQVAGMAAVLAQYIRENDLTTVTGKSERFLIQSLLSSTADALKDADGNYYSVLNQGAGLANVNAAVNARSYIEMDGSATPTAADGKIKAELLDDPARSGAYSVTFTINNMTEEDVDYELSGVFFTQDIFADAYGDEYLDTATVEIPAELSFTVNGQQPGMVGDIACDLDGDGDTDGDDVQALLDYIVLGAEKYDEQYGEGAYDAFDAVAADLDDDGVLTTYDAYLLLEHLNTAAVTVAAGRSVEVVVDIAIDMPEEYDVNGAWVEGYLFAEAQLEPARDGGEPLPEIHSIPVLGYYGSWLEPDMFDRNTLGDYYYGERLPYMLEAFYENGSYESYAELFEATYSSGFYVRQYGTSDSYLMFGNPFIPDDEYLPERNAFNSRDALTALRFSLIRNAGDSRLLATVNGRVLADETLGAIYAAYYYTNQAIWQRYSLSLSLGGLVPTDRLQEGDELTLSFMAAPEYYLERDTVNWDALPDVEADRYSMSYSMIVDNTAPEIDAENIDVSDGFITIPVSDNRYVAAVALVDEAWYNTGEGYFDALGADPDAELGEQIDYAFEIDEEENVHLLVQVFDYAGNYTTYQINLNDNELTDEYIIAHHAITLSDEEIGLVKNEVYGLGYTLEPWGVTSEITWRSSDERVATVDADGYVTGVGPGTATITATSTVTLSDGSTNVKSDTCDVTVTVIETTLIGALQDADGDPMMFSWDLENDETWRSAGDLSTGMTAAAWDWARFLYLQDWAGFIQKINVDSLEVVDSSASSSAFGAPMEDLALAYFYNDANHASTVLGIYGGYLLISDDIMENTFDTGWSLGSYLSYYTGASSFVALAWDGVSSDRNDCFVALDDAGCIWYFEPNLRTGQMSFGIYDTDLNLSFTALDSDQPMGNSLVLGEDGNYYLSHFNGSTNEIYQLTFFYDEHTQEAGFTSRYVGNVGEDVWPAVLIDATENTRGDSGNRLGHTPLGMKGVQLLETELAAEKLTAPVNALPGGLNAVTYERTGNPTPEEPEGVTVTVTADEALNNGLFTLNYDPEHLTFEAFNSPIMVYSSVNVDEENGVITFGFATLNEVEAEGTVFTVNFSREDTDAVTVTVTAEELNDGLEPVDPEEIVISNALTGASLASDTMQLLEGGTRAIELVVEPEDAVGYTVEYSSDNEAVATVNADGVVTAVSRGTAVITVTVTPADGDPIELTLTVTVRRPAPPAEPIPDDEVPLAPFRFDDVQDESAFYFDPVYWAVEKNVTKGTSATTFSPDNPCTRSEIVTFLYRAAGEPEVGKVENPFTDVEAGSFYEQAVLWAVEKGITKGTSATTFSPTELCTRGQIVTFLWRAFGSPAADAASFTDVAADAFYADAVAWAVAKEITKGTSATTFSPDNVCTRGESVTFLYRAYK